MADLSRLHDPSHIHVPKHYDVDPKARSNQTLDQTSTWVPGVCRQPARRQENDLSFALTHVT